MVETGAAVSGLKEGDGVQAEIARVPYAETSVHLVPEGVSDEQVLFLADIQEAYDVFAAAGEHDALKVVLQA